MLSSIMLSSGRRLIYDGSTCSCWGLFNILFYFALTPLAQPLLLGYCLPGSQRYRISPVSSLVSCIWTPSSPEHCITTNNFSLVSSFQQIFSASPFVILLFCTCAIRNWWSPDQNFYGRFLCSSSASLSSAILSPKS